MADSTTVGAIAVGPVVPRAIEDHGVVGDLMTVAVVATDGTIDFLCWPRADGPTVFAALLDPDRGGEFAIAPALGQSRATQAYLPDTNVLVTRWMSEQGSGEVVDLMPVTDPPGEPRVVRRVTATRGTVAFRLRCRPRFDYARRAGRAVACDRGVRFDVDVDGGGGARLVGTVPIRADGADATAEFTLAAGASAAFVFDTGDGPPADAAAVDRWVGETTRYWRTWAAQTDYAGRWREAVMRSGLVMKLLTSREHHSMLAAATFGLPEAPGGERNWDYRATWIRDASFTVYAFLRLGYRQEAVDFLQWVSARIRAGPADGPPLRIMYALDGRPDLPERSLDHLAGYGGARPVRVGNAAIEQAQLDIYGELLDTGYLVNKYARAIDHDGWERVTRAVEYVCEHWGDPDAGIWEARGEPRHRLHSRVMCWVAVDRATRLAHKRSLPAPIERWNKVRGEIHADVWANFWCAAKGRFAATRGGDGLDGAMLMLPLVRFCGATDPRWVTTLDAIGSELTDDGLVYRYRDDDGLVGREGAFLPCSFWYAECLARAGRLWEARVVFERALGCANHVGLFAEEVGRSGQALGNFPQALTHLAMVSAAHYLDRELSGKEEARWRS